MNKGIAAIAAGSLTVLLSTAAANADGRECDQFSPCTPQGQNQGQGQHQGQGQNQGQGQGQNQNATGIGTGIGIGHGGNAGANSTSAADVRNTVSNVARTDVAAVNGGNSIRTEYINPATPGMIHGNVNGQCMKTTGVSIGAYLGSIASQGGELDMDCAVWNTALVLLSNGINLHDPMMQAVAIETFREMDRRIDNAVISVMMAAQTRQMQGLGPSTSAWGLIDMNPKHGQDQRQAPRILNFDR